MKKHYSHCSLSHVPLSPSQLIYQSYLLTSHPGWKNYWMGHTLPPSSISGGSLVPPFSAPWGPCTFSLMHSMIALWSELSSFWFHFPLSIINLFLTSTFLAFFLLRNAKEILTHPGQSNQTSDSELEKTNKLSCYKLVYSL